MTSPIGHNGPPKEITFNKRRWALAIFADDDKEKPAGAVALAFKLYMTMDSYGRGAVVSDEEFVQSCGCSYRACQNFKRWLLKREYVAIIVRGTKGRGNEFQAELPARCSAICAENADAISASIAGKNEDARHILPANNQTLPASNAENAESSANNAENVKFSPAPARAEVSNIYNNINNLPTITPSHSEQDTAREGEEAVGFGVFVNCETIRHKAFTINLKGIECQLLGTVPMDEIKQVSLGHALQWATDIADGKTNVVPKNTASFIRQSIQNQKTKAAHLDYRPSDGRRSGKQVPRPAGKSFAQLNDEILSEIEREKSR